MSGPMKESELNRLTHIVSEARRNPRDGLAKAEFSMAFDLNTADALLREIDRLKGEIVPLHMIDALRADEGNSVTILCDNPEGPPNNAVECNAGWTDWQDRRFGGDTLIAALGAAHDAMLKAR